MEFAIESLYIGTSKLYLLRFNDFDPAAYLNHLTSDELERYSTFNHLKRKREFIATRLLRHHIFGFKHIHYTSIGAPFIPNEGFISISHAENLVGIAVNLHFQIGLDIELCQPKAKRLFSKFLNEVEKNLFDTTDEVEMTKCWSAKEALYKLAGRKKLDFKKDLLVKKSSSKEWHGKIIHAFEFFSVNLFIQQYQDYIISLNTTPIEIIQQ